MDHIAQLLVRNATVLHAKVVGQLCDLHFGQANDAAQLLPEHIDKLGLRDQTVALRVQHLEVVPQIDADALDSGADLVARVPHIVQLQRLVGLRLAGHDRGCIAKFGAA